jgi:hypothetical protein
MKKFIKTVSFIFALLLIVSLLGAFTSCAEPDEGINDPTENDGDPAGAPENDPNKTDDDSTGIPELDPSIDIEVNADISSEAKSEIQSKFFEETYKEEDDKYYNSPDQVGLTCYGIFDDAYCVILTYPSVVYPSVITDVRVGKYRFQYGNNNTMWVYYNGEFYGLTKAYEDGILDDTELGALYNYYTSTKWGKVK